MRRDVDLRSDTVTRPTSAMREAIASAEVGDAVLGDDPTVNRLEEMGGRLLGKEVALFFPSGTMANQTALLAQSRPGTEGWVQAGAHVLHYEEAGAAALSGLQLREVAAPDVLMDAGTLERVLRPPSPYLPEASVVVAENTHLASGGRILPVEGLRGIWEVTREEDLALHLDGARLWHASAETGVPVSEWSRWADTVMVSLSKGLGAPVGSLLAGPKTVMERAWRIRRRLGGGMRQAGLLAAGALHALEHHRDRLLEDHRRAKELALGMESLEGIRPLPPETNVVLADLDEGAPSVPELLDGLARRGVLLTPFGGRRVRAVTHMDVNDDGVSRALSALEEALVPEG